MNHSVFGVSEKSLCLLFLLAGAAMRRERRGSWLQAVHDFSVSSFYQSLVPCDLFMNFVTQFVIRYGLAGELRAWYLWRLRDVLNMCWCRGAVTGPPIFLWLLWSISTSIGEFLSTREELDFQVTQRIRFWMLIQHLTEAPWMKEFCPSVFHTSSAYTFRKSKSIKIPTLVYLADPVHSIWCYSSDRFLVDWREILPYGYDFSMSTSLSHISSLRSHFFRRWLQR